MSFQNEYQGPTYRPQRHKAILLAFCRYLSSCILHDGWIVIVQDAGENRSPESPPLPPSPIQSILPALYTLFTKSTITVRDV